MFPRYDGPPRPYAKRRRSRWRRASGVLASLLLAVSLLPNAGTAAAAGPAEGALGLVAIPTLGVLTPALLGTAQPLAGAAAGAWMRHHLTVTLILRRPGPLPQPVARSIVLPPRLAVERVAPTPAAYRQVVRYLTGAGLVLTHRDPGHLLLQVAGSVAAFDRAFHARIGAYRTDAPGPHLLYGPRDAAQVPAALAPSIAGVFGLSSFSLPVPAPLAPLPLLTSARPGPDAAGPAVQADKAPLAGAVPLAGFTLMLSHPEQPPVAGIETDVSVTLRNAAGQPLAGYTIEPVVPSGVSAFQGPTGPGAMVTNAAGHASFWLLSSVPQSFDLTALALPPKGPAVPGHGTAASASPPGQSGQTATAPGVTYLTGQALPVVVGGTPVSLQPYTAAQVNGAYGVTPLLARGDNGHGVGIGIVIWNRFSLADVRQYMISQGIPMPHVHIVVVDGPLASGDGGTEATLDVERSGATAPGADITVWDAGNTAGVLTALVDAIESGQDQILSLSWGIPEADLPDDAMDPLEVLFDAAAQAGITVLVASGDTGSYGNGSQIGVGWPASSPMVLAVGGTEMAVGLGTDSIAQQAAWSPDGSFALGNGVEAPAASGGGYSRYYPRPVWQIGPGLAPVWEIPFRGVPDVSLAATYPGYVTIVNGKSQAYGGTSAAAPTWAGILADIESGLGLDLGPEVMPLLYAFAGGLDPTVFRPVTQGENGAYTAHAGWNPVTGLGTPDAQALYQAFAEAFTPKQVVTVLNTPGILASQRPVGLSVAVLDDFGIPLGGVSVTAQAPQYGKVSPGQSVTGPSGIATFTVEAERPGIRTFTFSVAAHAGPAGAGQALTAQWTGNFQPPMPPTKPASRTRGHKTARAAP